MPQPRKYKTNAERQAAYRGRKAAADAAAADRVKQTVPGAIAASTPGQEALVARILRANSE